MPGRHRYHPPENDTGKCADSDTRSLRIGEAGLLALLSLSAATVPAAQHEKRQAQAQLKYGDAHGYPEGFLVLSTPTPARVRRIKVHTYLTYCALV